MLGSWFASTEILPQPTPEAMFETGPVASFTVTEHQRAATVTLAISNHAPFNQPNAVRIVCKGPNNALIESVVALEDGETLNTYSATLTTPPGDYKVIVVSMGFAFGLSSIIVL